MAKGPARRRRHRHWTHRRTAPGESPGTLIPDPEAPRTTIHLMVFDDTHFDESPACSADDVKRALGKGRTVWVDVTGLGDAITIAALGDLFRLHRLVLEDVVNTHQRAKLEEFESYLYLVLRMPEATPQIWTDQLSLFLGRNFVLTFQEVPGDPLDPVRERLRQHKGRVRTAGPDYLMYAILDAVIDSYFPILEAKGEVIEEVENEVVSAPSSGVIGRIHEIKADLLTLRRAIWPLREAITNLQRETLTLIHPDTRPYLRDCYDHTFQIMDLVETYRELTSGFIDIYLTSVSNKMNEVMKMLTIIATIFIPLTFIVGVYGMNFDTRVSPLNMPELESPWGYPVVMGAMALIAVAMLIFFRRKGWLGGPERTAPPRPTRTGDRPPPPSKG